MSSLAQKIQHNERQDYNCLPEENVYFLMRVVAGLKGNLSDELKTQLINQIDKLIKDHQGEVKSKAGAKHFEGLRIVK